jgi:hypothetical protein
MKARLTIPIVAALLSVATAAGAASFRAVTADEFDPGDTHLVQGSWLEGIGCPTEATIRPFDPTAPGGLGEPEEYTDPACESGDPRDDRVQGLLLAKTGPTENFASATAELRGVRGMTVNEVGYDIRKPLLPLDPRGSHCGGGAPRFNLVSESGTQFIACASPPPTVEAVGNGWIRLRWTVAPVEVERIQIVFDEGQDTGPDNFGLAVLDNIFVNGVIVGQGNVDAD